MSYTVPLDGLAAENRRSSATSCCSRPTFLGWPDETLVSSDRAAHDVLFIGTPALVAPSPGAGLGRPRSRPTLAPEVSALEAGAWAAGQPARAWRVVSWRNGTQPAWRARFCATRVTPAHDWRDRRLAAEVWLLCERALGTSDRTKYYLVHLPSTASLSLLQVWPKTRLSITFTALMRRAAFASNGFRPKW